MPASTPTRVRRRSLGDPGVHGDLAKGRATPPRSEGALASGRAWSHATHKAWPRLPRAGRPGPTHARRAHRKRNSKLRDSASWGKAIARALAGGQLFRIAFRRGAVYFADEHAPRAEIASSTAERTSGGAPGTSNGASLCRMSTGLSAARPARAPSATSCWSSVAAGMASSRAISVR